MNFASQQRLNNIMENNEFRTSYKDIRWKKWNDNWVVFLWNFYNLSDIGSHSIEDKKMVQSYN